jgi:hypothetical protein
MRGEPAQGRLVASTIARALRFEYYRWFRYAGLNGQAAAGVDGQIALEGSSPCQYLVALPDMDSRLPSGW